MESHYKMVQTNWNNDNNDKDDDDGIGVINIKLRLINSLNSSNRPIRFFNYISNILSKLMF
ncbi:hypothetical protein HYC85_026123 [Camellia sinensis]|uniref:Uncharacterized protein n=1 Tax=Camellia sinensis TaxID=4442 RepID=A0A7J7G6N8_CAMSI|nr:hypothetical protein HYC85_026123 [Camellia sinensis]